MGDLLGEGLSVKWRLIAGVLVRYEPPAGIAALCFGGTTASQRWVVFGRC